MKLSKAQRTALFANFSYILDIAAFAIILPAISDAIHVTSEQALKIYSAYGISLSVALIIGGNLTDKIPAKILFSIGVLIYALSAFLIVFSGNFYELILLRSIQGIGAALFSPCVPLIISRSGNANSAESLTVWGFWSGVAAAVSPVLFSLVITFLDWRVAWLTVPLIAIIALTHSSSIDDTFRLRRRESLTSTRLSSYLMFAYVFISYGLTTWFIYKFPLLSGQIFGLSTLEIGFYSTILWATFAVVCWLMKSHCDQHSLFVFLKLSPLFIFLAALLFNFTPLSVIFVGIAMAFANMPTTEIILRDTESSEYGLVASLDITCARLGGALSVVMIPQDPVSLMCVSSVLCILLIAFSMLSQKQHAS